MTARASFINAADIARDLASCLAPARLRVAVLAACAAVVFLPAAAADPVAAALGGDGQRAAGGEVCAFYENRAWKDQSRDLHSLRVDLWRTCEKAAALRDAPGQDPAVALAAEEMMAALDAARRDVVDAVLASWRREAGDIATPPGALWQAVGTDTYVRAERLWVNTLRAEGLDPFAR